MLVPLSTLMNLQSPFCLVIGSPISHTLSPLIHNTAAEYHSLDFKYYAVDVSQEDLSLLPDLFSKSGFIGANVTLPYKTKIGKFLDNTDESAREIGAVNTIVKSSEQLTGYNTDAFGFTKPLEPYRDRLTGKKAVVFGTGGASKAVVYGLKNMGVAKIAIISRDPEKALAQYKGEGVDMKFYSYQHLSTAGDGAELFVNTTPVGMEPNTATSPVPADSDPILANKICYDIVYKPLNTTFLQQASRQNAIIIDGLDMFIHQGARAFELWTGKIMPHEIIRERLIASQNK
ncbi:MAG: shikimate dehydrogenase [Balneolales bacterium]